MRTFAGESRVRRYWSGSRVYASLYDFAVGQEGLLRTATLPVGDPVGPLYADIARLRELSAGTRVLDVPCGGGLAFRGLPKDRGIAYAAVDLSELMLGKARGEARRLGLRGLTFTRAGVERLPYADGAFDLCLTYNGLHCFPDQRAALAELARVLRPGGELRGSCLVSGSVLALPVLAAGRFTGALGEVGSAARLREHLRATGFEQARLRIRAPFAYFTAVRAGA